MKHSWLKERREQLGLNQDDVAARLQLEGFAITRGAISHWENGRHDPPLNESDFRMALAKILKLSIPTLLQLAGYEMKVDYSEDARYAAEMIDQMTPDKRRLALGILEKFLETA